MLLVVVFVCGVLRAHAQCTDSWQTLGSGLNGDVWALIEYEGDLVAGGTFTTAGGQTARSVARWDGTNWHRFGAGIPGGVAGLAVFEGDLVAGGYYIGGGQPTSRIFRWKGTSWQPMGSNQVLGARPMIQHDGDLIAEVTYQGSGGALFGFVSRWTGSAWVALGTPLATGFSMAESDGELLIGGMAYDPVDFIGVLRRTGSSWTPVGSVLNTLVLALANYNGDLIHGGDAAGDPYNFVARLYGSTWEPMGSGMNDYVRALAVYNGYLIAAGDFTTAGGVPARHIARWDGTVWSALDPLGLGAGVETVHALAVHEGRLIAGGSFNSAGGQAANRIAAWNGCQYIEAVDPNFERTPLLPGGRVSHDWNRLASFGKPVTGLVADGVTRIVLRFEVPYPTTVTFSVRDENDVQQDVGLLSVPGETGEVPTLEHVHSRALEDGRHVAFAVLRAPLDFSRGPLDELSVSRPLRISAAFPSNAPVVERELLLSLRRPPVLLLHGLWSEPSTWDLGIQDDPRFTVHPHDYYRFHAEPFADNVKRVRQGLHGALARLRKRGIAATQADVLGHSMGGLLARLYVSGEIEPYLRWENFMAGDVHKLITLDSPHMGSALADALITSSGELTNLGRSVDLALPVDRGAVADLRSDSDVLTTLPAAQVPAHAMVGVGGQAARAHAEELHEHAQWLLEAAAFVGVPTLAGTEHDLVVTDVSQWGEPPQVGTEFGFLSVAGNQTGIHFGSVTRDARVNARLVELLNARTAASLFSAGFPASSAGSEQGRALALTPPVDGLRIVSPAPGSVVDAGQDFSVEVEGIQGFEPQHVLVSSRVDLESSLLPPFECVLSVPLEALGSVELRAFGFDAAGIFAESEPVSVNIQTSASITALSLSPEPVLLFDYLPEEHLRVTATFSDGVERDVTAASLGTAYSSADPTIAVVDADGRVSSVSRGTTTLTTSNGGQVATTLVEVISIPAVRPRSSPRQGDGLPARQLPR